MQLSLHKNTAQSVRQEPMAETKHSWSQSIKDFMMASFKLSQISQAHRESKAPGATTNQCVRKGGGHAPTAAGVLVQW